VNKDIIKVAVNKKHFKIILSVSAELQRKFSMKLSIKPQIKSGVNKYKRNTLEK